MSVFQPIIMKSQYPKGFCVVSGQIVLATEGTMEDEVSIPFYWFDDKDTMEYTKRQALSFSQAANKITKKIDYQLVPVFEDFMPEIMYLQ